MSWEAAAGAESSMYTPLEIDSKVTQIMAISTLRRKQTIKETTPLYRITFLSGILHLHWLRLPRQQRSLIQTGEFYNKTFCCILLNTIEGFSYKKQLQKCTKMNPMLMNWRSRVDRIPTNSTYLPIKLSCRGEQVLFGCLLKNVFIHCSDLCSHIYVCWFDKETLERKQ